MARQVADPPVARERRLKMTYDEFLALDDVHHAEWVDGDVTIFVPTAIRHAQIAFFIATLLAWYARRFKLGTVLMAPVEMRLAPIPSSREPDILFVATDHLHRFSRMRLDGPADLVVELLSDESVTRDRRDKLAEYEAAGVREYLIVEPRAPREDADLLRLTTDGTYQRIPPDAAGRLHLATLPGFWLDPAWLRQDPLPEPEAIQPLIAP